MNQLQTLQTEARAEYPKHCENSYCQWRTITLDDSLTRRAYLLGVEECEKAKLNSECGCKCEECGGGAHCFNSKCGNKE
jgi:hypothetical protein